MTEKNWILEAEMRMEAIRKSAEMERDCLRSEFASWPIDDARRWAVSRLTNELFNPVLGLYIRRVHLNDPAWWEQYAPGSGRRLLEGGRSEFDRHLKGKLIVDLVGCVEHPFRLILRTLDPSQRGNQFFCCLYQPTEAEQAISESHSH